MKLRVWFFLLSLGVLEGVSSWGDEPSISILLAENHEKTSSSHDSSDPEGSVHQRESSPSSSFGDTPQPSVHKKKKLPHEKDADGSLAPNRFENDIIIKSRYELNGQPLEVDTD